MKKLIFRNLGMEYYGLDACHYMSLPGYSWDSMLKMTGNLIYEFK